MTSTWCVLLFAVFCSQAAAVTEVNEAVLEEGANGTTVVLLSVAHIKQAAIFTDDNQLLRRIAYVETRDGTDSNFNSEAGGIWAVSETAFRDTKNASNAHLTLKYQKILLEFNIGWQSVQFSDLRRPLYSALAARLVLFTAPRTIPSSGNVEAQAQFWREDYNINGNVDDFTQAMKELQGGFSVESSASDFYVGFKRNIQNIHMEIFLYLYITTREPDPVPFTVDTLLGCHFTAVATRDSTTVVPLGNSYQVFNSSERNKGIHVSAGDKEIIVYGLNYGVASSDAFLALPCSRLAVDQYEYYAITYDDSRSSPSQLLFVGCEDDTTINFASTTITLNEMETYLYEMSSDITGARVTSDKPISFLTGNQCTFVPSTEFACDHLTEQVPPTANWGTTFLSASFSGRMSSEIYRVLASQPSTDVSVNCTTYTQPETYSLTTAGAWQEFMTPDDSFCVIESNKPLLVAEFALSYSLDAYGIGDPFMMMIPSIEQYSNDYVFNVPARFSNFITIYVSPVHFEPEKIFVDDISQEQANWTTIYCLDRRVCGYATYASLEAGHHCLYHSDSQARIGMAAYGFRSANSYGYPGGLQYIPTQLSFSQETYFVGEKEMALNVSVMRSGNTESHVEVLIASDPNGSSATAGQDYFTVTNVLEFSPGVTEKKVEVKILDDMSRETNESFVLYLASGAGVFLSPFAQAEVIITSNDESCPADTTTLLTTNTTYSWPVTEIGVTEYQLCPSQLGASPTASVSRYCGGSISSGAVWSDVDYSQCSEWVASIIENVTSQPEDLQSEKIAEVIELIDTVLTEEAIVKPEVTEQYLNIIDYIQQVNTSVFQMSQDESVTSLGLRVIESLRRFQDEVILFPNATNGSQVFTRKKFAIEVRDIDIMSFSGETFNVDLGSFEEALSLNTSIPEEAIQTTVHALANITTSITVPSNLFTKLKEGDNPLVESRRLSYSVFLTDILFQSPNQTAQNLSIETVIIAVRLRNFTKSNNGTVQLLVNNTFRFSEIAKAARSSFCVHMEATVNKFGEWSSDGCREVESEGDTMMCECSIDHPSTHFAVLFDLNPSPPPPGVGTTLEVITYVGLAVSVLSLIIMIITYLSSKDLRSSHHGQILLNICTSLLGLYIFFLIAAHVTSVTALCGLVSALLQYFILVFFGWTAAEAVYLYVKLVKILGTEKYENGFTWKAGIIVWSTPALIVIISLAGYKFYTSNYYCRPTQWPFFFGLVLPVAVIIIFNWIMFIVVIASIINHTQTLADPGNKGKFQRIRQKLITAIILAVMFGLGWGLGFLATSTEVLGITITFQIIFAVFVGSQGLLLLVFHGFRSEKARGSWKHCLKTASGRYAKAFSLTTTSTSDTSRMSTAAPSCSKEHPNSELTTKVTTVDEKV